MEHRRGPLQGVLAKGSHCDGVAGKHRALLRYSLSHKEQKPRGRNTGLVNPLQPGEENKQRTFCIEQRILYPEIVRGPCFTF